MRASTYHLLTITTRKSMSPLLRGHFRLNEPPSLNEEFQKRGRYLPRTEFENSVEGP